MLRTARTPVRSRGCSCAAPIRVPRGETTTQQRCIWLRECGACDAAQVLIASNAPIDPVDAHGNTPLKLAAQGGMADCVHALLNGGANPDLSTSAYWTPIQAAALSRQSRAEIMAAMLDVGAPMDDRDFLGVPLLHRTISGGDVERVKMLLDRGADKLIETLDAGGSTALAAAAGGQMHDIVEVLLEVGADPSPTDSFGRSPLHNAAQVGDVTTIEMLCTASAQIDMRESAWGRTPLHHGAFGGHSAVVRALAHYGADPSATDSNGRTPLLALAEAGPGSGRTEAAIALLDAGADIAAQTPGGQTALTLGRANGDRLLVEALQRTTLTTPSPGSAVADPANEGLAP